MVTAPGKPNYRWCFSLSAASRWFGVCSQPTESQTEVCLTEVEEVPNTDVRERRDGDRGPLKRRKESVPDARQHFVSLSIYLLRTQAVGGPSRPGILGDNGGDADTVQFGLRDAVEVNPRVQPEEHSVLLHEARVVGRIGHGFGLHHTGLPSQHYLG